MAVRPDVAFFAEVAALERLAVARIERLLPAGMTNAQFVLLGALAGRPGATPAELCGELALSKAALSHSLQKLEARGLLRVAADAEDGRRKRLTLTADGEAAYAGAAAAVRPLIEALRGRFTAWEFEQALPTLKAVRRWLTESA